jgi:uncharacterized protein DUF6894
VQVVTTIVARGDTPTVEFRGEGGENVAVTLAPASAMSDEELIAKAKVMLLHAAALDEKNEAKEPASSSGAGETGLYTLEYQDKGKLRSVSGLSFASEEALLDECKRSAEDLWQDALSRAEAPVGWAVRARDHRGNMVASVNFEDIQRAAAEGDESTAAIRQPSPPVQEQAGGSGSSAESSQAEARPQS